MATHSSVLAWRIPGTGEPGGLPSMGSHRVGHNWSDLAAAAAPAASRFNNKFCFIVDYSRDTVSSQQTAISIYFKIRTFIKLWTIPI